LVPVGVRGFEVVQDEVSHPRCFKPSHFFVVCDERNLLGSVCIRPSVDGLESWRYETLLFDDAIVFIIHARPIWFMSKHWAVETGKVLQ
jgi:hypothetical protein